MSTDGSVITGSRDVQGFQKPFRFSAPNQIDEIGFLPDWEVNTFASALSSDGQVVVGYASRQGWRWDETTGLEPLPRLQEHDFAVYPVDLTADGSLIMHSMILFLNALCWSATAQDANGIFYLQGTDMGRISAEHRALPQWLTGSRLLKLGESIRFNFYTPSGLESNELEIFPQYLRKANPGEDFKPDSGLSWLDKVGELW